MWKYVDNNIDKIIKIFLFLQPVIDCLTSFSMNYLKIDITFGVVVRFLFLIFLTMYVFFNNKTSKITKAYFVGILVYFIFYISNIIISKDISCMFYEGKNLLRYFYFPILLIGFSEINKKNEIKINNKLINYIYYIYILLIIIPMITNTDFVGYFEGKVGSIGWFQSTNEISAILSGLLPFILIRDKYNKLDIVMIILSVISLFSLGSKVTIIFLGITLVFALIHYFKNSINKKKIAIVFSPIILICLVLSIYLVPKTNFYKNIQIHLDFLGINNIVDIFKSEELIDHFIFSSRLSFLKNTRNNYLKSKLSDKFLGIGFIENYGMDNVNLKTIEMDIFDIFYRTGIVGFILYLFPIYIVLVNRDRFNYKNLLSIFIFVLISALAGHVLTSPAVSIYLVILLVSNVKEDDVCKQE